MSIRDELASLLDRHLSDRDNEQGCRLACGYDGDDRCEHLADAILARYGVVELPEPDGIGDDLDPYGWSPEVGYIEVNTTLGIYLSSDIGNSNLEPSHARELAAALLAAANRAEAQA